jgi:hypothetical protein
VKKAADAAGRFDYIGVASSATHSKKPLHTSIYQCFRNSIGISNHFTGALRPAKRLFRVV